jgi:secreted PhoX family phosphatase
MPQQMLRQLELKLLPAFSLGTPAVLLASGKAGDVRHPYVPPVRPTTIKGTTMSTLDRRSFLTRGAAAAAGSAAAGTTLFRTLGAAGAAPAPRHQASPSRHGDGGYGPLARTADQNGDEILALPDGFQYVTFSKIGEPMSDGTPVPVARDGMGAFKAPGHRSLLIRNHEVRTRPGTVEGSAQAPPTPSTTSWASAVPQRSCSTPGVGSWKATSSASPGRS